MAFNARKTPGWDITRKGKYLREPQNKLALDNGGVVYMMHAHGFYNFLKGHKGIDIATKRAAESVRRTIANRIPLGEYEDDGHLKYQLRVRRTKSADGRPSYLVYSEDGRKDAHGIGSSLWIAEFVRKKQGKPMWTKQALAELEIRR